MTDPTQTAATPDGWKLVPLRPTREMLATFYGLLQSGGLDGSADYNSAVLAYKAMLATAPKPPP